MPAGSAGESLKSERPAVVLGVLVAAVALSIGLGGVVAPLVDTAGGAPAAAEGVVRTLTGLVLLDGVLLALTWARLRALGLRSGVLGLTGFGSRKVLARGVAAGFGLWLVNAAGLALSLRIFETIAGAAWTRRWLEADQGRVAPLLPPEQPALMLFAVVLIAGLAPLAEEVFFRGYAYGTFRAHWGRSRAMWWSGVLFGAVHLYVIHFLPIAVVGMVLAALYERWGTLAVPFYAHAFQNALVALAILWRASGGVVG